MAPKIRISERNTKKKGDYFNSVQKKCYFTPTLNFRVYLDNLIMIKKTMKSVFKQR